jgi:hypothetical protein
MSLPTELGAFISLGFPTALSTDENPRVT